MTEVYFMLGLIKIFCEVIYLILMIFESNNVWNKVTRLILAIIILIFSIIALGIGIQEGISSAITNVSSIIIWIAMIIMGINRLRE